MPVRLATQLEAILYLKGQPLTVEELVEYAGKDRSEVEEALLELVDDYAHRDSALEVCETPRGFSLQLCDHCQSLLESLVPAELGTGALRTLAAIAMQGPIIQTELIELRGSGAYEHVRELVELGLIRKRRQSDGRSFWLEVTPKFHQYFELDPEASMPIQSVGKDPVEEAEKDSDGPEGPLL
ncbi:MAG: SMC-Scp complex subunit ScpB [Cyanobacteria bacterium P01_H01_bin.15]